jgi:hypothetical protein
MNLNETYFGLLELAFSTTGADSVTASVYDGASNLVSMQTFTGLALDGDIGNISFATAQYSTTVIVDEWRFGTALSDAMAIPEPSTYVLWLLMGTVAVLCMAVPRQLRGTCRGASIVIVVVTVGLTSGQSLQSAEIAHYTFDNTFNDSSPSMNHLTVASGTPSFTAAAGAFAFGSAGLDVVGTDNEYLKLTNPISFLATDPWTIAFWARRRTGATNDAGMIIGEAGSTDDFIWITGNFGGFRFRSSTANTEDFTAPKDSTLRHFALVADGTGDLDLYINGAFSSSQSGNTSFNILNIAHAYNNNAYTLDGNIDELFIFNEALNPSQIASLAQTNSVPEVTTIVMWQLSGLFVVAFIYFSRKRSKVLQ